MYCNSPLVLESDEKKKTLLFFYLKKVSECLKSKVIPVMVRAAQILYNGKKGLFVLVLQVPLAKKTRDYS